MLPPALSCSRRTASSFSIRLDASDASVLDHPLQRGCVGRICPGAVDRVEALGGHDRLRTSERNPRAGGQLCGNTETSGRLAEKRAGRRGEGV